ncbi:MAG: DUF1799 domain-containing protein [Betaproteobacteria bacterium]|nr:DUF1799 domain-containing protein [Betaproteobacteria bacterium]
MGIPDEEPEPVASDETGSEESNDEAFFVWPENKRAHRAFLAVRRLWRIGPMGGVLGLDRPNVESELRMRKIALDGALLDDLDAIEGGVLEVWNEKK